MKSKWINQVIAVVFALTFPMLSALMAHHSAALFQDDEVAAKGVFRELTWRNPHVLVHWDIKTKDGKTVRWVGELASVTTVMADGFRRESLKDGDEIILTFRPARAGTPESVISSILRPDGTIVLPWSRQSGAFNTERNEQRAKARAKLLEPFGIKVVE